MPAPKYALSYALGAGARSFCGICLVSLFRGHKKKTAQPCGRAVLEIGNPIILQLLNAYVTDLQAITVTQETNAALLVEQAWVVQIGRAHV